jgi:hypothetical protein
MIAAALLLAATALGSAAPGNPPPDAGPTIVARSAAVAGSGRARFPGFAVELLGAAPIVGPKGWPKLSSKAAWAAIAAARPDTRQSARWAYARSLIGQGRGQEARGVLEIMLADDGDLALVPSFQLAMGAARAEAGDAAGASAALGDNAATGLALTSNPEACAWRIWAFVTRDDPAAALTQLHCALPALRQRTAAERAPFLYAGARAALAIGRPAPVAAWLASLPDNDPGANLYRGRAALALGDVAGARLRLARVTGGSHQQQFDANVSLLEAEMAGGTATPAQIARIDKLAFVWRGDAIEQRVLALSYRVGSTQHDLRRTLNAGATLLRHCKLGARAAPLLAELQAALAAGLAPESVMPIAEAAGLYWEYRDLVPTGGRGDFLVSQLADRLQAHGLYARAADLLRHQLVHRARDVAQGPLSTQVASLYILAGRPTQALATIHDTDANAYPVEMRWDRQRVEAVALYLLGRRSEALAVLQDVPGGAALRAEIAWKSHDWSGVVAETGPKLPAGPQLSAVDQAIILRLAIAFAMLGREPALAQLHARYAPAFAGLPSAAAFDLLTRDAATLDTDKLTTALLAIPSASPAGKIGDLFDIKVVEPRPVAARPAI